ncbi:Hpt domain-containing protein [Leptolyngbya sp. FACHB-541]|uniref:hybrid sensor histidine kinase/response regulator n=1 Tax=Leptolyngbya sp. FACHB-541 TaxID=2692810 RepID=UPI0016854118|nr:Hpt domain-containing protein [Leptolyngbya sp. FACHB-541]MBD1997053.1 Hpt domain-containing protein [Leptolyngbya sp. FACHB-541]
MKIDDEELRDLYELSSQERLRRLEAGFLHLQEHPEDEAVLEELRRDAHSLKGDSRSVGVETVEAIIQQVEAILKTVQTKRVALTAMVSDRLQQGLHAVNMLVHEAVTGQQSEVDIPHIVELLMAAHQELKTLQPFGPAIENPVNSAALSSFIDDEELRNLYDFSSQDRLQKLQAGLLYLQQHPNDATTLEEMRREAHGLKGDSRSVGVEDIEVLIQQIEGILKNIQAHRCALNIEVSDRIRQGLEAIGQLVHEAVTGQPNTTDVIQILDQLVQVVDHPEEFPPDSLSPVLSSFIEDEELRHLYEISSQHHLQTLKEGLRYLEQHPTDQATLEALQQETHSLKGDSRGVGADAVETLTHHVEEILKAVQLGRIAFLNVSDRLYQELESIHKLVQETVTGQPSEVDVLQEIELLLLPLDEASALSEAEVILETAEAEATEITIETADLTAPRAATFIEDDELREIYKIACRERLQRIEAGLLRLEKHPEDEATLEQLLREAHSLKGDSRSVGVDPVETLIHQIEEVLGGFKHKRIALTVEVSDRLYQGLDAIGKLVHEAVTGQISQVDTAQVLNNLVETSPAPDTQVLALETVAPTQTPAEQTLLSPSSEINELYRIDTIRVPTRDLDALMTQAEELTVTKTSIGQIATAIEEMSNLWRDWRSSSRNQGLSSKASSKSIAYQEQLERTLNSLRISAQESSTRLDKISGELREKIRTLRLLPLSTVFQPLPRTIRDLAKQQSKDVELIIEGGDTTADKSILEEIKDSLMHLVRNAIDHGIETRSERQALGKPTTAKIWLKGYQTDNKIVIEVADDGRGLDLERIKQTALKRGLYDSEELAAMSPSQIHSLIFVPGFSTRSFITEISGRGIGLDVVRNNIERLKGEIQIESNPGQGCTFRIQLNTTLTTIDTVLLDVQGLIHALPIEYLETTLLISESQISTTEDKATISWNGQDIPVADLSEMLKLWESHAYTPPATTNRRKSNLQQCVLLKVGEERAGFFINRLFDAQEIVIKPQSQVLKRVRHVAGATILPTGEVCTILNAPDLIKSLKEQTTPAIALKPKTVRRKPTILLVEDSVPVRTQEKRLLERAGYEVVIAVDGLDGYNKLQTRSFDAVLSDVEMPNLDGLSLTAKIRQQQEYKNLPIVLVTTLDSDADKKRGADAGADAYVIKGKFNQDVLLEILERLVN